MSSFNASNAGDGAEWECAAMSLLRSRGWKPIAGKPVDGKKVTVHGVDIDLVMADPFGTPWTIEAKGTLSGAKRPGAQRTDTVKKAIADAWFLSRFKGANPHLLYASHLPESGIALDQLVAAVDAGLFVVAMSPDRMIGELPTTSWLAMGDHWQCRTCDATFTDVYVVHECGSYPADSNHVEWVTARAAEGWTSNDYVDHLGECGVWEYLVSLEDVTVEYPNVLAALEANYRVDKAS